MSTKIPGRLSLSQYLTSKEWRASSIHSFINDEKLSSRVSHKIVTDVANEEIDIGWRTMGSFCWNRQFMLVLIVEQHFKTSTVNRVSWPGLRATVDMRT